MYCIVMGLITKIAMENIIVKFLPSKMKQSYVESLVLQLD